MRKSGCAGVCWVCVAKLACPCACCSVLYAVCAAAKSRQHPDFPGGHPPEYYPSLRMLNFAERTGYGVLSLRWPSTKWYVTQPNLLLYPSYWLCCRMHGLTHQNAIFVGNLSERGELSFGNITLHLSRTGNYQHKKLRTT
jgi:hypothetical protein